MGTFGSGILFVLVAFTMPASASTVLILFGIVYSIIGVIGFSSVDSEDMSKVLGILHVNRADNFLHVALGLIIFLAGVASKKVPVAAGTRG